MIRFHATIPLDDRTWRVTLACDECAKEHRVDFHITLLGVPAWDRAVGVGVRRRHVWMMAKAGCADAKREVEQVRHPVRV